MIYWQYIYIYIQIIYEEYGYFGFYEERLKGSKLYLCVFFSFLLFATTAILYWIFWINCDIHFDEQNIFYKYRKLFGILHVQLLIKYNHKSKLTMMFAYRTAHDILLYEGSRYLLSVTATDTLIAWFNLNTSILYYAMSFPDSVYNSL